MITNAIESDFLQGNFFPGFSDNNTLLIKVVKGFVQRPQKIFLTSLIQKANNLIGKCIETAQFSEFATFFFRYITSLLERISQGRMTNVNVCFSVLIPKKYPPPPFPPCPPQNMKGTSQKSKCYELSLYSKSNRRQMKVNKLTALSLLQKETHSLHPDVL